LKTLTISEAEAKAVLRLAERISAAESTTQSTAPQQLVVEVEETATPRPQRVSARSAARAARRAENRAIMASIRSHMDAAKAASDNNDPQTCLQQVKAAMQLVPPTWDRVAHDITAKAVAWGLPIG